MALEPTGTLAKHIAGLSLQHEPAADAGHPSAQIIGSAAYANGNGVEQDLVVSYMWGYIVGRNPNYAEQAPFQEHMELLLESMTEAQVSQANALAESWEPTRIPAVTSAEVLSAL